MFILSTFISVVNVFQDKENRRILNLLKNKEFCLRNSRADAQSLLRHILLARHAPPHGAFLIYGKFEEFLIY